MKRLSLFAVLALLVTLAVVGATAYEVYSQTGEDGQAGGGTSEGGGGVTGEPGANLNPRSGYVGTSDAGGGEVSGEPQPCLPGPPGPQGPPGPAGPPGEQGPAGEGGGAALPVGIVGIVLALAALGLTLFTSVFK